MTLISQARVLASDIATGTYVPTALDACEAKLTLDRVPHVVRLTEFTLFTEAQVDHFSRPRYLTLQPQFLQGQRTATRLESTYRGHIRAFIQRWESDLPTSILPPPTTQRIDDIRDAVRGLRAGSIAPSLARRTPTHLTDLPSPDLPGTELRTQYAAWLDTVTDRLVREHLRSMATVLGADVRAASSSRALTTTAMRNAFVDLVFPGPYHSFASVHSPVALCATFEQLWELRGYTRGELVTSLTLAPGERLTLEVHSWDKSSRRSEDELSTEFEMRTSEKMTQRDALTVIQEYAHQQDTKVEASGVVPIPKMPIKIGANVATQSRDSLRRTTETVRDETLEAANTLKLNRKLRVEVSRDVGREEKQTRLIENTNRCHALNCHYFELLATYVVTTRAVAVRPCVLLRNPRATVTPAWVLCHEGILIRSLLDRTFLPGFESAKAMRTRAVTAELEAAAHLAQLEALGDQVAPLVTTIVEAYLVLAQARAAAEAALAECGFGEIHCIFGRFSVPEVEHLFAWFALPVAAQSALDRLANDQAAGRNAAVALRALLTVVGSTVGVRDHREVFFAMSEYFGFIGSGDRVDLADDLLSYDDAGVRAAVTVAANAAIAALGPALPALDGATPLQDAATAEVEFERLRCHLEENWLHYNQAVWSREDHGQRFMRLQAYGPIAAIIENELLGFYGDRAAYPLRDVTAISEVDLTQLQDELEREIEDGEGDPLVISMPTAGLLLEAVTGDCDACEEFIRDSRHSDLRLQAAKAAQAETEASRLQARVDEADLSDPSPEGPSLAIDLRTTTEPS